MRIISANVNGIRAAAQKGFFDYLSKSNADVVCLQEVKAHLCDLHENILSPHGYHGVFECAQKKGYSGVAIYSKEKPINVQNGLGIPEFDAEGRFIRIDFKDTAVLSWYLPSGSSSEERQEAKYRALDALLPVLKQMINEPKNIVICGDWNIAHQNIDLKNWKANQKNSGFLPEERAWLSHVLEEIGWVDIWRTLYPEEPGYTWWSYRGQAYAKDVGWRIDYQIVSPQMAKKAQSAHVYKDERFSDHAPLIVDYA
ncbi:exodeoxyribonuclease III [Neisseria sp. Ec49-e6-T10]|uniref:exodeoxyribonuclease III n=1 Tax=Neisseria sp. Ec49-e6-T10 TaxID=3140744 RepID=UPI003EBD3D74